MKYYEDYWDPDREWPPKTGKVSTLEEALFSPYFRSNSLCLDYGCGTGGRYGIYLRDHGIQYRGFDISAHAIAQAQAHGLTAELLTGEGKTSLPDGCCNFAVCFEVFEHLLEPHLALAEIARVLSPKGVLLASVPNAAYWFHRCEFLISGFLNPGGSPLTARKKPWADPHIRFFSPKILRRFFLENGFKEVEIIPTPFSLAVLPYIYRTPWLRVLAGYISAPFGWLSRISPGLFASGLYARACLDPTVAGSHSKSLNGAEKSRFQHRNV